jgi:hypothetical protein
MSAIFISLLIVLALVALVLGTIWILAYNEFWWCFIPANTFALVTWGSSSDPTDSSNLIDGELDKVIHGVPGKRLNDDDPDPFKWFFEDGEEEHGILYHLFGIHWIGWGRSLRLNQVHEIRFKKGKDGDRDVYSIVGKDFSTKFIYYSREQAVDVRGAETLGSYELDLQFNLLYAMKYPVHAVLGMADPNAVLTAMVMEAVNNTTGAQEPEYFIQGDASNKRDLVKAVLDKQGEIEEKIGITVRTANLLGIDVDAKTRALLELQETTERENKAAVARAEKDKQLAILAGQGKAEAQMAVNAADADRITRVLVPLGAIPNAAGIRFAEAIGENKTLTTLVVGGKTSQLIGSK